jgi:hypothetical protein
LIKLLPNHNRRLLEHLIGAGPSRKQRPDEAPQVGLMLGKARHEGLVADIIRAGFQGHITHRLISDSILPHLKKSNSLKKSAFTSPPKRQS